MQIRPEVTDDREAIRQVHRAALGDLEAGIVDAQREADRGYGPSLVARVDGAIVGHVLFADVDLIGEDRTRRVSALAPLSVVPAHQRRGIGTALVGAAFPQIADRPVVVLGHLEYYPRFGFLPATDHGIDWPYVEAGDETPPEFMVWFPAGLKDRAEWRGRVVYPACFDPPVDSPA